MSKTNMLFESMPGDDKINFVKAEMLGVENGDPIIDAKHVLAANCWCNVFIPVILALNPLTSI